MVQVNDGIEGPLGSRMSGDYEETISPIATVQAVKASTGRAEGSQLQPAPWEGDLMVGCRAVVRSKTESTKR